MELLVLIGFALLVSGGFLGLDFVKLTGHALDAKFGTEFGSRLVEFSAFDAAVESQAAKTARPGAPGFGPGLVRSRFS
jgi:hypothetical protein